MRRGKVIRTSLQASVYHGLMDKDVVELMKLHEELANMRYGQKTNSGQRQA